MRNEYARNTMLRKNLYMIGSKATHILVLIQWSIFLMERAYKIPWSRQKLVRN